MPGYILRDGKIYIASPSGLERVLPPQEAIIRLNETARTVERLRERLRASEESTAYFKNLVEKNTNGP